MSKTEDGSPIEAAKQPIKKIMPYGPDAAVQGFQLFSVKGKNNELFIQYELFWSGIENLSLDYIFCRSAESAQIRTAVDFDRTNSDGVDSPT